MFIIELNCQQIIYYLLILIIKASAYETIIIINYKNINRLIVNVMIINWLTNKSMIIKLNIIIVLQRVIDDKTKYAKYI